MDIRHMATFFLNKYALLNGVFFLRTMLACCGLVDGSHNPKSILYVLSDNHIINK